MASILVIIVGSGLGLGLWLAGQVGHLLGREEGEEGTLVNVVCLAVGITVAAWATNIAFPL